MSHRALKRERAGCGPITIAPPWLQVCQWFASRADLILLLFDPHKLDISDELKEVIAAMKGNEEKMRVRALMSSFCACLWAVNTCLPGHQRHACIVWSYPGTSTIMLRVTRANGVAHDAQWWRGCRCASTRRTASTSSSSCASTARSCGAWARWSRTPRSFGALPRLAMPLRPVLHSRCMYAQSTRITRERAPGAVGQRQQACRVFVGSFNGGEAIREDVNPNCRDLFHKEYDDLMEVRLWPPVLASRTLHYGFGFGVMLDRRAQELHSMPQRSCDRKVNELVKRVRALRVHLLLLQHLKSKMPALLFKQSKAAKILEDMPDHFLTVRPSPPRSGVLLELMTPDTSHLFG